MADTTFTAGTTVTSPWLNDVNDHVYGGSVTPKMYGAVGDGVTDDKTALLAAFASGKVVDGGGLTYAINGTCAPTAFAGFQNAKLIQIGDNTTTNLQTLKVVGFSNFFIRDVSINMGTNVSTLFSDDSNSGLYVGGVDSNTYITNFSIINVSVTGNGCGAGIQIRHSKRFTVTNCLVYDRIAGSSPDPTNDSQDGIELVNCANFTLANSNVYNLKTRLGGVDTAKWTRGFLFVEIRDGTIVGCNSTAVDQGFDFSGAYDGTLGYTGNRRWVLSSCTANNCLTYGFKFANVTKEGQVIGCVANNTGTIGFVFSPSAATLPGGLEYLNTQNIDVVGCKVNNVLGTGWSGTGAQGFRIMSNPTYLTYPRGIRFSDCHVADTQTTPTTLAAFASDAAVVTYSSTDYNTNIANTMINCTCTSNIPSFNGDSNKIGPPVCFVTASAVQSIPNAALTTLNWDVNTWDANGLHSTSSNNSNIYIKSPGMYEISAQVTFAGAAGGQRMARLFWNTTFIDRSLVVLPPAAGVDTSLVTKAYFYAKAGDYFSVKVYQDSGGALNLKSNESSFSVRKIG